MKKILMLTKALLFNQEMGKPAQKRKSRMYQCFGALAIACIIIPCCLIVGILTCLMTQALIEAGGNEQGLLFVMHFMAVFALIFGFQVVLSTFYFSSDLEHLLPLPLKIHEIITAKLLQTYLAESMMEFAILLSAFIGYFVAAGISVSGIVTAVIGTFTLPVLPLLYCGIISTLLMAATRRIRSPKDVSFLVWGLSGVLFLFVAWAIGGIDGLMVENFVSSMVGHQNRFMNVMNVLFFHDRLLAQAIAQHNPVTLIGYLLVNIGIALGFLALASRLYLPGVHRMASIGNKRRKMSSETFVKACRMRRVEKSFFYKEMKTLTRTGAYVTNCMMMTYVWPVVTAGILLWKGGTETLLKYRQFYEQQRGGVDIIFLLCILLLSVLIPGANAVASTSFTREGAHIDFMKYIPVSYEKQIMIKGAVSMVLGYSSSFLCVCMLCIYFRTGIVKTVYMLVVSFLCCFWVTGLGIWLDSEYPKLVWENESAAMRGNINVFFHMAFSILSGMVFCILAYLMYVPTKEGSVVMHIFFLLLMLLLCSIFGNFTRKKAAANIRNLLS